MQYTKETFVPAGESMTASLCGNSSKMLETITCHILVQKTGRIQNKCALERSMFGSLNLQWRVTLSLNEERLITVATAGGGFLNAS